MRLPREVLKLSLCLTVTAAVGVRADPPPLQAVGVHADLAPPLKIGLSAMVSPKETLIFYTGLLEWAGARIGRKVEVVQFPTYEGMDLALERREVEIAFVCSGPYVRDHDAFGAELLVAPQSRGRPAYRAYVIAPYASPAQSLADLRGRSFAFTDPESNTGRIVPTFLVERQFGTAPERFFRSVTFTFSHDRAIDEVSRGAVEGASVNSLVYDYLAVKSPSMTKGTKIIETSEWFGLPPVVVHPRIDPALRARLREAFLAMHEDPKGKAILDAILVDRFVVPRDEDYESVREMERWLARHAAAATALPMPVPAAIPAVMTK